MADPLRDDDDKPVPRSPTVNPSTPTTSISGVDPSIIREFIEVTKRDLELRQQELDIQRQEKAEAHEYAKLALQAQANDRSDQRGFKQRDRRDKMGFALCGIVLLGAFLLITLYMGYERIAFEVVKDLGLLIVGGMEAIAMEPLVNGNRMMTEILSGLTLCFRRVTNSQISLARNAVASSQTTTFDGVEDF